jgi:hypothetical protein
MFRAAEEECAAGKFAGTVQHWRLKNVRRWEVACNSIEQRNGNWAFLLNFVSCIRRAAVCFNFDKAGTAVFGGKFCRNVGWKRCCVRSIEYNVEVVHQINI